jgi:uncharacterized protein (TIGR00369 family)
MGHWQSVLERIRDGHPDASAGVQTARLAVRVEDALTWEAGVIRRRWNLGPWALNLDGAVFGGLIAALADQMTSFAAFTILADDEAARTASLQVDYFRPVVGAYVEVEARVVNRSRRLIHTETQIKRDDGKVAAHARAVIAIVPSNRSRRTD